MCIIEIASETEEVSFSCQESLIREQLLGKAHCISCCPLSGDLRTYTSPADSEEHAQCVGKKKKIEDKEKKKKEILGAQINAI